MFTASTRPNWTMLIFLALGVLVLDQATKYAVEKFTTPDSQRVIVPGFMNFIHTRNTGVAFGMFADTGMVWMPILLILFSVAVIALLAWMIATDRAGGMLSQCGLAMIIGGAVGNVMDRILRHSVTDFIDVHIGNYHWYTFNIADSGIVVGAALVLLELFRHDAHPSREHA